LRNRGGRAWSPEKMRRLLLILFLAGAVSAREPLPPLLQAAVMKLAQDTDRWA